MFENPWELPLPPPPRPSGAMSPLRLVVIAAVTGAVVIAAIAVPVPMFFVYLPGPVRDVHGLVDVQEAKTYASDGELLLTTVSVDTEVTLLEVLAASLDRHKDVVPAQDVTGGESLEELQRRNILEMQASKQAARDVVFRALGLPGNGAVVRAVVEDSAAQGRLREGDVIVSIEGTDIVRACDVGFAMDEHSPGDEITITIDREGDRQVVTLEAGPDPRDPTAAFLGVAPVPYDPPVLARFRTGQIAGPSAGLMFTLALYDRLTPNDLTGGQIIAGTGTIACDGTVGPIGGIEEKVAAAEHAGAEVFLAPAANADAAKAVAGDIEVVSVQDFDDAVDFLEGR